MDEKLTDYGTTSELVITLSNESGDTRTIKLPDPKDANEVASLMPNFVQRATGSDTAIIGVFNATSGEYEPPTKITADIITTTKTFVYSTEGE